MPLSINVGLSRKASRDYQSSGVSINVTAELDQALLGRPDELQRQIGELYAQAQQAIESQSAQTPVPQPSRPQARPPVRTTPPAGPNGNGNGHSRNGAPMTASQRRAIEAIARRIGADPQYEARQIVGKDFVDLSLQQASELIDHLKGLQPAGGRNGR